ncbi:unnamed protein product [Mytilus edulis]|uniref:Uncharacterized protein n=1 Tax=Mytilus edulis TaxID=6550 RepID=A0A8S3VP17_MYTED|nr:unnamed protein product [Mytilus edulis]
MKRNVNQYNYTPPRVQRDNTNDFVPDDDSHQYMYNRGRGQRYRGGRGNNHQFRGNRVEGNKYTLNQLLLNWIKLANLTISLEQLVHAEQNTVYILQLKEERELRSKLKKRKFTLYTVMALNVVESNIIQISSYQEFDLKPDRNEVNRKLRNDGYTNDVMVSGSTISLDSFEEAIGHFKSPPVVAINTIATLSTKGYIMDVKQQKIRLYDASVEDVSGTLPICNDYEK